MIKKKIKFTILLFSSLAIVYSCAREFYNISYNGVLMDAQSHTPINMCSITATCYYQKDIDHTGTEITSVDCSSKGEFSLSFNKGYQIKLRLSAPGYLESQDIYTLKSGNINDTIYLNKKSSTNDLRVFLLTDSTLNEQTPYLRDRIYTTDSSFMHTKQPQTIGYDFLNARNDADLNNIDLWISKFGKNSGEITLKTHINGGIHPVFKNEIKTNFFEEITQAPSHGYSTEYTLTGNESGFFIKCRDGIRFAKVIHEEKTCIRKVNNILNPYIEQGIRFNYIFQSNVLKAHNFLLYD